MRHAALLLFVVAAALALAGPAHARLAFERGGFVYSARDGGSGVKRLARGDGPVISPDGRWVAYYQVARDGLEFRLVRATGGKSRRVAAAGGEGGHLTFSPDSKRLGMLLFNEVRVVDVRTRLIQARLTEVSARGLAFSPDSRELVYARSESREIDEPADLVVVPLAGGPARPLTADGRARWPLWTAQGIVFAQQTVRGGGRFPLYELFEVQPDGSGLRALTDRTVPITDDITYGPVPVARSADGARLLISVVGQSRDDAYALELASGVARPFGEGLVPLGLSRDGDSALLQTRGSDPTDRHDLVVADWMSRKRTTLIRNAMWGSWSG